MKESLYYLFLSGLILGTGPCAAFCAPILASYVVVYKDSFNKGVVSYAAFSAGRLISYAILGALCGGLSGILKSAALSGALETVTVMFGTGIALIG
ncbi:MAG: sulfite exporter TauE/SafE family protein, partial [Candidatus Omnitrophica bacterium]|nr:sulfite exporter TauE/SafE family protein [Candidatus Omnitrophota bacterium]